MFGVGSDPIPGLITLGIVFLVFLLLREVACWYWKINKILEVETEQLDVLKTIAARLGAEKVERSGQPSPPVP